MVIEAIKVTSPPRLRLLGQFRLEYDAKPVELSGNGQRLLAFVGLHRRVSRTVLAGTLWPEVTEDHARGSLRTTLWKLPRCDQALIRCSGDSLSSGTALRVDVHALIETAFDVVQGCARPFDARLPPGLIGTEELLPGWDEEWVLLERERLRQLRLHALDSLAETLAREGKSALALEAAWASVRSEPLRESAHRAAVAAHLAEGNLIEAVRQYHSFRQLLREELGVEPSPQFTRMLAQHGIVLFR
ncbi:AfsR/SARP family transcriptional regulator [Streptomyces canus]|uniref:AfsR/SARP family transcriptional regulator n=1 Tax=Streptomyces canus TaxID=58343 RepID=UPI002E303A19|nr:BTAD domain-containing putative transcriptional regulator [Streptomyces canus]